MNKKLSNQGFMRSILIIIIAIAALSYFNVDIRSILNNILHNQIITKIISIVSGVWYGYLVPLWWYLVTSISGLFK